MWVVIVVFLGVGVVFGVLCDFLVGEVGGLGGVVVYFRGGGDLLVFRLGGVVVVVDCCDVGFVCVSCGEGVWFFDLCDPGCFVGVLGRVRLLLGLDFTVGGGL